METVSAIVSDACCRHFVGIMLFRCILFMLFVNASWQEGQDRFFPYGNDAGDSTLPQANDEFVEVDLPEDHGFPFYGDTYDKIYINTNGLITFGKAWPDPQTRQFLNTLPLHPDLNSDGENEERIFAAPFWADVDTSNNRGNIYYRSSASSGDLGRASSIVRNNFPSFAEYSPKRVVVATWVEVSFYDHDSPAIDPRNTFQAVLISDDVNSFVFFFYDKVEWTTGTTLNGNPETGIPGSDKAVLQALVGFNKGDGYVSFESGIPEERTTLPLVSNINQPGSYAFQVNLDQIAQAGCSNEVATFVTYPPFGSILGGEKVNLYGPCWDGSNDITLVCEFWNEAVETPVLLQTVNGSVEDQNTAYCIPEPFFLVGEVTIKVHFVGGSDVERSGVYRILNLDRIFVSERVTRDDPKGQIWYTAGQELGIKWPSDVYPKNTLVDIDILNYEEDVENGPRWEKAFTIATGVENTGSRQFMTFGLDNITAENAFGVIRVQPSGDRIGIILYSDIHPLGYLLEDNFQSDPQKWAEEQCRLWTEEEGIDHNFVGKLESCPCTLDQALADTARFYSIHSCSMFHPEVENRCILNQGAKHCVMSIFPNADNAGSKCCYDFKGNLMYAGDSFAGSTSQSAHVAGAFPYMEAGKIPTLSYVRYDIVPLFSCCLMEANCKAYLDRRPTADCYYYESPKAAISFGDPHFITFDGSNYTFNGMGDYSLLHVGEPYNFKLEGRFEVIEAYTQPSSKGVSGATGLTAAVMFEDNANAIYVETSDVSGIEIYRAQYEEITATLSEWELVNFRGQMWLDFPGVAVSINNVGDYSRVTSITVTFRNSRIGINITRGTHEDSFLAVTPILPPKLMNDRSFEGLLGNWNNKTSDDLRDVNGNSLDLTKAEQEDINQYASTWKTAKESYFRETFPKTYNQSSYTAVNTPPEVRELTSSEQNTLNQVCDTNEQCRFDYLVTRNRYIASDTKATYHGFEWGQNKTEKIPVCKFIPTPANGTKSYQSEDPETGAELDTPNNFIHTIITFACDDGLTLVGSSSRYCQRNSEYSGSEIMNECVATPCGTLETVAYGSIEITMEAGQNAVATVTCDEGYSLNGPSVHECVNGDWSGDKSVCGNSGGTNAAVIAGATVGAFCFVAIAVAVAILLFVFYKKQQKHKPKKSTHKTIYSPVEQQDMGINDADKGKKSGESYGYKNLEAKEEKEDDVEEKPIPAPRSTTGTLEGDSTGKMEGDTRSFEV